MDEKTTEIIEEIKTFARRIRNKYKVSKMILFGSVARGDTGPDSDIDLILVSESFKKKSALKRPVPFYMEWGIRRPVDFLCYTPKEFDNLKNKASIVRVALSEGIEIKA